MDKKKVKELIENTIYQLDPFSMDGSNYDNLCKNAIKILENALQELSKSDWISVKDELPPYDESVLCCDIADPEDMFFCHRSDNSNVQVDENGWCFYQDGNITHWMRIKQIKD